ncbi:MAG TPA: C-GCAxxG-C-C family protein [Rhodoferax sp.]
MPNENFRVAELALKGYKCSHILVQIGLDAQEKINPDLLRAMSGLANGMGSGLSCGALSGGCCLIGMYAGADHQGSDEHGRLPFEHGRLPLMLEEYVEWFREEAEQRFGGIDCKTIMQDDPHLRNERCPGLILDAVLKAKEILEVNGFELDGRSGAEQG